MQPNISLYWDTSCPSPSTCPLTVRDRRTLIITTLSRVVHLSWNTPCEEVGSCSLSNAGWRVHPLAWEAAHLNHWATVKPPFILKDSYGPEAFGFGYGSGFLSVCVSERPWVNRVSVICATEASLIYTVSASGCRDLFLLLSAIFVCLLMLTGC